MSFARISNSNTSVIPADDAEMFYKGESGKACLISLKENHLSGAQLLLKDGGFQIIKWQTVSRKSNQHRKLSICDKPDLLLYDELNSQLRGLLFSYVV